MSGLNTAALQVGGAAIATACAYLSLHSATPNTSGSNETTAARVASGLTSTAGVISTSSKSFSGGAASGAVLCVGFWSASTAGTFYGYETLTGDAAFNAAGQYTLTSLTITGSAT
jgi:hypothetical protein